MITNKLILMVIIFFGVFNYESNSTDIVNTSIKDKGIEIGNVELEEQTNMLTTCPNVSNFDFKTLGPPDIPHKIRVIYEYSDIYSVVSWESNDSETTVLQYDGAGTFFGAYYNYIGYDFVDIKLTLSVGGNNCVSTHVLGWPQWP